MEAELECLQRNEAWELSELPPDKIAVGSKWVCKKKQEMLMETWSGTRRDWWHKDTTRSMEKITTNNIITSGEIRISTNAYWIGS